MLLVCVCLFCVFGEGCASEVKVTLTVNSDNGSFSLPSFLPLPSHARAEYVKPVRVGCYRRQMTLPAAARREEGFIPSGP